MSLYKAVRERIKSITDNLRKTEKELEDLLAQIQGIIDIEDKLTLTPPELEQPATPTIPVMDTMTKPKIKRKAPTFTDKYDPVHLPTPFVMYIVRFVMSKETMGLTARQLTEKVIDAIGLVIQNHKKVDNWMLRVYRLKALMQTELSPEPLWRRASATSITLPHTSTKMSDYIMTELAKGPAGWHRISIGQPKEECAIALACLVLAKKIYINPITGTFNKT